RGDVLPLREGGGTGTPGPMGGRLERHPQALRAAVRRLRSEEKDTRLYGRRIFNQTTDLRGRPADGTHGWRPGAVPRRGDRGGPDAAADRDRAVSRRRTGTPEDGGHRPGRPGTQRPVPRRRRRG